VSFHQTYDRPDPPLVGRWVSLAPLCSDHCLDLHRLFASAEMVGRWPRTEISSTPSEFEDELWRIAPINYVVLARGTHEVVGLVQGMNEDLENSTIGLSAMLGSRQWRQGWPFEAVILMIRLLFEWHDFRKIYCQFSGSTSVGFSGAFGSWLNHEATFERHQRVGSGWEDWHIYSLFRDQWEAAVSVQPSQGGPTPG